MRLVSASLSANGWGAIRVLENPVLKQMIEARLLTSFAKLSPPSSSQFPTQAPSG